MGVVKGLARRATATGGFKIRELMGNTSEEFLEIVLIGLVQV